MELMQLEMFVAMVEEGSFRKAADRVFRTQPALTMALRKLEQELGAPLSNNSTPFKVEESASEQTRALVCTCCRA